MTKDVFEYHQKRIEKQNRRMPKALRDVMMPSKSAENEARKAARQQLGKLAARAKGKRQKGNSMPLQEAEEIARKLNTEISEKPIETWGKQKPTASVRKEEDSDLYYVVVRFVGAPNKPVYEIHSRADYGRFDPVDLFPGSPML